MKLSEYSNEEKLELIADILEPIAAILSDKEVAKAAKKTYIKGAQAAIKAHTKEVIEILARIDNVPVAEYKYSMLALPVRLMEIINDGDFMSFFSSSSQNTDSVSSGLPTENTEA